MNPTALAAADLRAIALAAGADDCGFVRVDDPAIAGERASVLAAFARTRTLLAFVRRMHREAVRSPARSVANLEFDRAGRDVDDVARHIVRALEDRGIGALNPAMAFPMEMDAFPERGWIVSHKVVAEAAGLGRMGIHRSLIHPRFGSFVLLGTVLVDADVDEASVPLDYNPCVSCKLCVAACPVGAIKPDGYFDFGSCYTHNYRQFMGGFVDYVEEVAASRSVADFRDRVPYSENVERWQSLAYGPTYNAAYCLAVCPAGEDVAARYLADRAGHVSDVVRPLQNKRETVYVAAASDAADHVARRFPHKRIRIVRASGRATNVRNFLGGMRLGFQRGKAGTLDATYHFVFTGRESAEATVTIRDGTLEVVPGRTGRADLTVTADARTWIRFVNREISLVRALVTGKIRLRGRPALLAAFGRCFPG